jgi:pyruvate,water dikinase
MTEPSLPVSWLSEGPNDLPDDPGLGGKGRLLARMAGAGLPVPPGFILPAGALRGELPTGADPAALPGPAAECLAQAYAELGRRLGEAEPLVAVRSSALAEDLEQASFAGQYATVLGVRGSQEVLAAAARCWASLWSSGVAAYREAIQAHTGQVLPPHGMAILVQALVQADAAGVADTIDSARRDPGALVIHAAWGIGPSVMDGAVQPDRWRFRRTGLSLLEFQAGDKATRAGLGLDPRPEPVPEALRRQPCLTVEQAAGVAALALQAEQVLGCPADVEWALAGGKVWLLQARPLTGLDVPPAAQPAVVEQPAAADDQPAAEGLPATEPTPSGHGPAFPFEWIDPADAQYHWRREAGDARVFEALRPFELDARAMNTRSTRQGQWLTGSLLVERCLEANGYLYNAQVPAAGSETERALRAEAYLRPVRFLHERGDTLFGVAILPEVRAGNQRLSAVDPDALPPAGLAGHFEETLAWYDHAWTLHMMMDNWDDQSPVGRCARLYQELTGEENGWAIFAPFGHAPQQEAETVVGVLRLAQAIKASPALRALFENGAPGAILQAISTTADGPAFLRQMEAFLERYGWQSGASQGIMGSQVMPGWKEEPALLVAILQRYLPQDLEALLAAHDRNQAQFPQAIARLREKVTAAGATPEQVEQFDFWLAAVTRTVQDIIDHNHYLDSPINALMHRALLACGRRLAAAGALDAPADVWWLRAVQIPAAVRSLELPNRPDWRQLVAAQKALLEWQRSLTPPAYLGAPPPAAPPPPEPAPEEDLPANLLVKGWPAVPGRVTGRVRLVDYRSLVPDLQPGDIFVAPDCGVLWASLLPVAGAVVLEGSNPGEHAMRICRDFAVPGIVQAHGATRLLREGQVVTVDGEKGWVLGEQGRSA